MEDYRMEQKAALETLVEFNERLVNNMKIIVKELSGKRLEDTDIFLKDIVKALNWEIEVVNGTLELLNGDKIRLDKEKFNDKIVLLSKAIMGNDDHDMAEAFCDVIPEFEALGAAAKEVVA